MKHIGNWENFNESRDLPQGSLDSYYVGLFRKHNIGGIDDLEEVMGMDLEGNELFSYDRSSMSGLLYLMYDLSKEMVDSILSKLENNIIVKP